MEGALGEGIWRERHKCSSGVGGWRVVRGGLDCRVRDVARHVSWQRFGSVRGLWHGLCAVRGARCGCCVLRALGGPRSWCVIAK